MKMNIQIQKETGTYKGENIVEIDIKNGNWKYWDNHMETDEKISLTINNICKAFILNQPVKDTYSFHDQKAWKENREIKITSASVREYETLLTYLNYRINNAKEDYKKWGDTEKTYTAVLFDEEFKSSCTKDVTENMIYEIDGLITVKIRVVE